METNQSGPESQDKPSTPAPSPEGGRGRKKWIIIGLVALIVVGIFVAKWAERFNPEYYKRLTEQSKIDIQQKKWDQALDKLLKVVQHDPNNVLAHQYLARIYFQKNQQASAAHELEEIVRINPRDPSMRFLLGVAYQNMEKYEPALQQYRMAAEAAPNHFEIFLNVGMIHFKMKNYPVAAKAFQHVNKIKPDYFPAYFRLAEVYEAQGRSDLAIKQYQWIKKNVGKNPDAKDIMAEADKRLALVKRK